jgi:hypothetical protein
MAKGVGVTGSGTVIENAFNANRHKESTSKDFLKVM